MGIPKPLVKANQLFIVISIIIGLLFSYWILLIPFTNGVLTIVFHKNIIIMIGKTQLRKPLSEYVLEDQAQQLFNQWISTILLGLSILFFFLDLLVLGYIFSIMVFLAAGIALLGFCIGCFIRYQYIMWKHKRQNKK